MVSAEAVGAGLVEAQALLVVALRKHGHQTGRVTSGQAAAGWESGILNSITFQNEI